MLSVVVDPAVHTAPVVVVVQAAAVECVHSAQASVGAAVNRPAAHTAQVLSTEAEPAVHVQPLQAGVQSSQAAAVGCVQSVHATPAIENWAPAHGLGPPQVPQRQAWKLHSQAPLRA